MKVLLIPEIGAYGGCRTYFFQILDYLSSRHSVSVVTDPNAQDDKVITAINKRGVLLPSRLVSYFNRSSFGLFRVLFTALYDLMVFLPLFLKHRPDLIIVSTGNPPKLLSLFLFPVKFIYVVHSYPDAAGRPIFKQLLNRFFGGQKIIVTVSDYSRNKIISSWFPASTPAVVSIPNFVQKPKVTRKKPASVIEILTLGTNRQAKNPELWLKIVRLVNQQINPELVHFTWIGAGPWLQDIQKKIDRFGISNTSIHSFTDNPSIAYSRADIYFQPSRIESHGMAVVEAMSVGLPCVVSSAGGLPESVEHDVNGYIFNLDQPDTAAACLVKLINSPALRRQLGIAGASLYQQKFTRQIWQQKMDRLISNL